MCAFECFCVDSVYMWVCTCGGQRWPSGVIPQNTILMVETGFLTFVWNLLIWPCWLVSDSKGAIRLNSDSPIVTCLLHRDQKSWDVRWGSCCMHPFLPSALCYQQKSSSGTLWLVDERLWWTSYTLPAWRGRCFIICFKSLSCSSIAWKAQALSHTPHDMLRYPWCPRLLSSWSVRLTDFF